MLMPQVTQADRDAAAKVYKALLHSTDCRAINARLGNMDDLDTVQAFAAHREAADAKIVAWLKRENEKCDCFAREEGECACGTWDGHKSTYLLNLVDAIEKGQHHD